MSAGPVLHNEADIHRDERTAMDSDLEEVPVVFYKNPSPRSAKRKLIPIGDALLPVPSSAFESKYIGDIANEPGRRLRVFPEDMNVESALDNYFARYPQERRVLFPKVYIRRLDRVAKACAIDEDSFAELCLPPDSRRRLTALETEVHELSARVKEMTGRIVTETMLAVVDFQNIRYSLRELW